MAIGINKIKEPKVYSFLGKANIKEQIEDEELSKIYSTCKTNLQNDEGSREQDNNLLDEVTKVLYQKLEQKDKPWKNAANVKYPLITQACIDFYSKMNSAVEQNGEFVKPKIYSNCKLCAN